MSALDVLFLGGTGTISSACAQRAVETGHNVTVVTRGKSARPMPDGVEHLVADVRDPESLRSAVGGRSFDAVLDVTSFVPADVERVTQATGDRVGQYLFLSSASAYRKPPLSLPITERTELRNDFWQYSRDKIACERTLAESKTPWTVVRPSHTYDGGRPVTLGGWTDITRIREGRPIVLHGSGKTVWTMTHARDFAVGLNGLLGAEQAIGRAFNIMGDDAPSWNRIVDVLAEAAGVSDPYVVHVPDDVIAARDDGFGERVLGDRGYSATFDSSAVREFSPDFGTTIRFTQGARELIEVYDALPEADRRDPDMEMRIDRLLAGYE